MRGYSTELTYGDVAGRALVVETEVPWRMVVWEKAQYVPCWDVGDAWVCSQWLETAGQTPGINYEVIHDKVCKYSFARLVEDGPARSVFEWQYCLTNVHYQVFDGNARAVERFTVYPKGYCVRSMTAYPGNLSRPDGDPLFWEVLETIFVNPKGTLPTDYIEEHCATYMNLDGDRHEQHWKKERFNPGGGSFGAGKVLCRAHPTSADWKEYIARVHLKNRPDVFAVFSPDVRLYPRPSCGVCGGEHPAVHIWGDYALWSHWPVYMGIDPMDDRDVRLEDAYKSATHTSIFSTGSWYKQSMLKQMGLSVDERANVPAVWRPKDGDTWHFLFGATEGSDDDLKDLARSWLYPANVEVRDESVYTGYDPAQMAYCFIACDNKCSFRLDVRSPLVYPVVVIENWHKDDVEVKIDGRPARGEGLRVSVLDGKAVVWIEDRLSRPCEISLA